MMVLTALLIVSIKLWFPEPSKNSELLNEFWLRKTHTTEKFNVVVGGDSRIYRGFSIDAMLGELHADMSGINMGYSSAGFSADYMNVLEERLKISGDRILVLGVTPHSFTLEAAKNELFYQYKATDRFGVFKGLYLSPYLKHFAPYSMSELRDNWQEEPEEEGYFEEFIPNGWVKSYKIPEDSTIAVDIYRKMFTDYQVSDTLMDGFFDRVSKIRKKGIHVIAYRPPTFDAMTDVEDSLSGYDEGYMRSEMEKRGCFWLETKNADYHTYDGSHLHYLSAEKLARNVGILIRQKILNQP